ncbi:profilin [Streptomyces sp. NPDC091268]|uniref:profilin n=1 Tax=Streptomyces sp. NPDC091268 TaxID=3365979 RepID=UPI00382D9174
MDRATAELRRAIDASGCVAQAEVLRMDGTVRCSTGGFLTSVQEGRRLARLFENPADAVAAGITVGGVAYTAAEANGHLLHGRHADTGVVAVRRPPFIVVGLYPRGRQPSDAVLVLDELAALLASGGH